MSNNGLYPPGVTPTTSSARGWQDYLADRPFPAEYDTWDQVQQRHYERGRLRAAGAGARYRRIPANEPRDVVQRLNGLRLVPRRAKQHDTTAEQESPYDTVY